MERRCTSASVLVRGQSRGATAAHPVGRAAQCEGGAEVVVLWHCAAVGRSACMFWRRQNRLLAKRHIRTGLRRDSTGALAECVLVQNPTLGGSTSIKGGGAAARLAAGALAGAGGAPRWEVPARIRAGAAHHLAALVRCPQGHLGLLPTGTTGAECRGGNGAECWSSNTD
jgi:hypothetical protein